MSKEGINYVLTVIANEDGEFVQTAKNDNKFVKVQFASPMVSRNGISSREGSDTKKRNQVIFSSNKDSMFDDIYDCIENKKGTESKMLINSKETKTFTVNYTLPGYFEPRAIEQGFYATVVNKKGERDTLKYEFGKDKGKPVELYTIEFFVPAGTSEAGIEALYKAEFNRRVVENLIPAKTKKDGDSTQVGE
jgi:hypothetical protein